MKKHLIFLSFAALALTLAACGQPTEEVTPSPKDTSMPKPTVVVTATAAPTAAASVEPKVTFTPEPSPETTTAAPAPTSVATAVPKPAPTSTPTPVLGLTPDPIPEPTGELEPVQSPELVQRLTDEEVLAAYREARTAYNWFVVSTLEGHQDEKVEYQGNLYVRVADERFPNMDSFRSYLKNLFSDEVVDGLLPLEGRQYVEMDGRLYVLEGGRDTDITKGAVTLLVVWPQEEEPLTSCTVRVEVELLDEETLSTVVGSEVYEFPYQKVGDKWVFTWFAPIN